ncbi:hypothetical protein CPB83DRAFT_852909 [Crepidotus variabilis]|uniref:Uncharacterized protein n=1 Tax=Crepidotus variabilis TaxID=179855 RepID=A0A9P6JQZ2_9AGAR|nr:hypothetical protein CPB83DRAFT_852909 [Crepidotus variabilis]
MPPKARFPTKTSNSKDLVSTGPKEVFSNLKHKEKGKKTVKESTSRALILRNGKHGARGTGEVMLVTRMTGREKMDLLAEDLVEKGRKAIMTPFRLEECLKIAESQCDVYVDDIANLRDADLFFRIIEAELAARNPPDRGNIRRQPTYVAKVVATRLHNSYMLASAWKIVSQTLNNFATSGVTDQNIKAKLKNDTKIRDNYLVLWDMVNKLVSMSQDQFSVLATTAPHYKSFFKLKTESEDPGETEYVFDWSDLRKKADSFIDSIITELCFPQGMYPKAVLYQLLQEAVTEAPKDVKRFPQALWDAVGDLSISVQLQELLNAPLFGADGDNWKKQPRQMPEEYENWVDAQLYSTQASEMTANFKDVIFPLEKAKKQSVIDTMWKHINTNYQTVSGKDIDVLWNVLDDFNYSPQWTSIYMPGAAGGGHGDDNGLPKLISASKKKGGGKQEPPRITNGETMSTDEDMPDLQSVSNSDEETDDDNDDDSEEEDDSEDDDSDDSGYNTEEEDEIRELLREAMDAAHEVDWMSKSKLPEEIDPLEDKKGNPFLKLLGSLRGRMFSSNPKLKTPSTRAEPRSGPIRGAFRATPSGAPKAIPKTAPPKPSAGSAASSGSAPGPKSQKATVEDVSDDDDDTTSVASKKKKKKKPKKKKKASSSDVPPSPSVALLPGSMANTTLGTPPTSPKRAPAVVSQTTSPKPSAAKTAASFSSSTTTLPIGETTAQSGHSYLQSLNVKTEKKSKSRPDHASLFGTGDLEKKGKGLFSKLLNVGKDSEKSAKQSWFSRLGKKTNNLMHQLLRTSGEARAPMKWDDFVKLMLEMGFTYDPSTAGSSVRFDPPSKNDPPITFHKPHPDPTLEPHLLREFAKKLKRRYGWDEADLARLG